jgi:hypothetical protein
MADASAKDKQYLPGTNDCVYQIPHMLIVSVHRTDRQTYILDGLQCMNSLGDEGLQLDSLLETESTSYC